MADKETKYTISLKDMISSGLHLIQDKARKLNETLKQTTTHTESLFGSLMKFNILSNVGNLVVDTAKDFIKFGAEMESSNVAFEVLLGSASKAKDLLGEMKTFADKTPFEFGDLTQAGKTMLGFQIPLEKIMPLLKSLGDVSMGNAEKFQRMTLAYSQAFGKGKLQGEELRQMVEAGFNPLKEISKNSGKSIPQLQEMMHKGQISIKMMEDAFISATKEGGAYFGMMDRLSQTFSGKLSTLKDKFHTLGLELFNYFKPTLMAIIDGFSKLIDFVKENADGIQYFIRIILPLVTAGGILYLFISGLELLRKGWVALNLAMKANPVMFIISAIILLGQYIYQFVNSEYWQFFVKGMQNLPAIFKVIWGEIVDTVKTSLLQIQEFYAKITFNKGLESMSSLLLQHLKEQKDARGSIEDQILAIVTGERGYVSKEAVIGAKRIKIDVNRNNLNTTPELSKLKSNTPHNININIEKLIESFKVETTNIKEGAEQIKELVAKALIEAVNDVNLAPH